MDSVKHPPDWTLVINNRRQKTNETTISNARLYFGNNGADEPTRDAPSSSAHDSVQMGVDIITIKRNGNLRSY